MSNLYYPPVDFIRYPVNSGFYDNRPKTVANPLGLHLGVDYRTPVGTPVRALGDGVVAQRLTAKDAGRFLSIDYVDGLRGRVLHLSDWNIDTGKIVQRGDVVAFSGNTGTATTGPHLHEDHAYRTLREALQRGISPVYYAGWYRVDPFDVYKLREERDELENTIILQSDTGVYYIYNPLSDSAVELSGAGYKALKQAEKERKRTLTGVAVTQGEVAGINK